MLKHHKRHYLADSFPATRRPRLRKYSRILFKVAYGGFAVIGLGFTAVFIAMQFGLLNVQGSAKERNAFFDNLPKASIASTSLAKTQTATSCIAKDNSGELVAICPWNKSEEWGVVRAGLSKDSAVIDKVAVETGVPARMIAAAVAPEQLRFFSSERESFKKYFEPLKTLGSMSQFSLGVAGIKQATADHIEQYTIDTNSPYYAGPGMSTLVAYPGGIKKDSVLYDRLSNSKNHYYSYLYAALFIKEIENQWQKQGFDITARPDVVTTLFNIGFEASKPKANPQIGGTPITLNRTGYTFGELGTAFYLSDELTAVFPTP